jgi:hypothetical protein
MDKHSKGRKRAAAEKAAWIRREDEKAEAAKLGIGVVEYRKLAQQEADYQRQMNYHRADGVRP